MGKIVECIPNFSEGRRSEVISEIVGAIKSVPGVVLLDQESDPDHNRSVVTFVASPDHVVDAAIAGARKAAELIDLNTHTGEHPRMGATDVVPFVPISGVTMEDCVRLARECGERMWREIGVPVYLYERAATRPERENLATVRKGQFEGIRDEIATNQARWPDFGEPRVHPTAGITAVGARPPLIAYNINLGTSSIEIANKVARAARHQTGGLRYVKALGFELKDRGLVQISMNMVNYEGTPLFRAFELVKREAERYGVPVVGSEIVGLVPQAALNAVADFYLQLENFSEDQILEHRLQAAIGETAADSSRPGGDIGNFAESIAAGTPTPGGGSVAAYCGLLASALGRMMCNLSIGKQKYVEAEPRIKEINSKLEQLADRFRALIGEDAASFEGVLTAHRLPKETEEQKAERSRKIDDANRQAVITPLETATKAVEVLELLDEVARVGNPNAFPDITVGAKLADAAVKGAFYNIGVNLGSVADNEWASTVRREIANLIERAGEISGKIEAELRARVG